MHFVKVVIVAKPKDLFFMMILITYEGKILVSAQGLAMDSKMFYC